MCQGLKNVTSAKNKTDEEPTTSSLQEPIESLNEDCWHTLFDYLSFGEIYALSQTCKQLLALTEDYFSTNFPNIYGKWSSNGLYLDQPYDRPSNLRKRIIKMEIVSFSQHFLCFDAFDSFCWLKTLNFCDIDLTLDLISNIKNFLNTIKVVKLQFCRVEDEILMEFLMLCPNLKHLHLSNLEYIANTSNKTSWLRQNYRCLERLELDYVEIEPETSKLTSFLKQHPNVKYLGIDATCLWINRHILCKSDIKLDYLAIYERYNQFEASTIELIKNLFHQGFYKILHVNILNLKQVQSNVVELASLSALEAIAVPMNFNPVLLIHLMELDFGGIGRLEIDCEEIAKQLTKLERLCFHWASTNYILPFIQHTKRLTIVKLNYVFGGNLIKHTAIDLMTLNKERKKLDQAKAVSIYVRERTYLATKWKTEHLNLCLVIVRRLESLCNGFFRDI